MLDRTPILDIKPYLPSIAAENLRCGSRGAKEVEFLGRRGHFSRTWPLSLRRIRPRRRCCPCGTFAPWQSGDLQFVRCC